MRMVNFSFYLTFIRKSATLQVHCTMHTSRVFVTRQYMTFKGILLVLQVAEGEPRR